MCIRDSSKELLQEALGDVVCDTYNMVSVDGDTSTNDTVLLLANGMAGNAKITERNASYNAFKEALKEVNTELAKAIAADGEGATALFEVKAVSYTHLLSYSKLRSAYHKAPAGKS